MGITLSNMLPALFSILGRWFPGTVPPNALTAAFPLRFYSREKLVNANSMFLGDLVMGGTHMLPALVGTGWFLGVMLSWGVFLQRQWE